MKHVSRFADAILVTCSIAMVVAFVQRKSNARPSVAISEPREFIANWKDLLVAGVSAGPENARITIVEFGDLECPACRRFHLALASIRREADFDVRFVLVHYPLANHRFAVPAARAVECAREQHRGGEMVEMLFTHQDSLGLMSWAEYGRRAAVPSAFVLDRCLSDRAEFGRIDEGRRLGERLGVRGTPTILANGWRISPGKDLDRVLRLIKDGKPPYADYATRSF